jgi:hypothetical protein
MREDEPLAHQILMLRSITLFSQHDMPVSMLNVAPGSFGIQIAQVSPRIPITDRANQMFRLRHLPIDTLREHIIMIHEQTVCSGDLGFNPLDRVRVWGIDAAKE